MLARLIADVDEAAREIVLTIHWRGGQHSQLPDGTAHRSGQVLDGAPCQLAAAGAYGIRAYRSASKSGEWLRMSEAASALGLSRHRIRRLIKDRILPAEQGVAGAPHAHQR